MRIGGATRLAMEACSRVIQREGGHVGCPVGIGSPVGREEGDPSHLPGRDNWEKYAER